MLLLAICRPSDPYLAFASCIAHPQHTVASRCSPLHRVSLNIMLRIPCILTAM